jgi:hypothetical protein
MAFQQIAAYMAAILFAALAATVLAVGISGSVNLMPLALGIAAGHASILGLPLFLLFRSKGWANALSAACGGLVTGVVPLGALAFTWPRSNGSASVNGMPTMVDGATTLAGWLYYAQLLTVLGSIGALSGIIFWLTLRWSGQLTPAAQNIGGSQLPALTSNLTSRAVLLAPIALALTGAVAAIPEITKDRTCQNMFRDGRPTVHAQANIQLDVGLEEWAKLIDILEKFGAAHDLSFRNTRIPHPGVAEMLYLGLCNEQGVNVSIIDQRWASRNYASLIKGGTHLDVYELRAGSGWERIAQALVSELDSAWPGRVRFLPTQAERAGGSK